LSFLAVLRVKGKLWVRSRLLLLTFEKSDVFVRATRVNRETGDAMNPGELEDKLEKYEQIKDLAAMRHYEGWQHDCTKMLDLL
jgi:hypothetical protein